MAQFDIALPDQGVSRPTEPRVNQVSFGDGYSQRVGDGINSINESWQLRFTLRTRTEIQAIDAFLRARNGVEAFDWAPPDDGVQRKVICQKWTPVYYHDGNCELSCEFNRVYEA